MTYAEFLQVIVKKAAEKGVVKESVVWAHLHVEGGGVIQVGLTQPTRVRKPFRFRK